MRGTKRIAMWLRALVSRRTMESELDEEMRFHLDMEAAKHTRHGVEGRLSHLPSPDGQTLEDLPHPLHQRQ